MIASGFNIIGLSNYYRNVIWGSMLILVTIANYTAPAIAERLKSRKRSRSSSTAGAPR